MLLGMLGSGDFLDIHLTVMMLKIWDPINQRASYGPDTRTKNVQRSKREGFMASKLLVIKCLGLKG